MGAIILTTMLVFESVASRLVLFIVRAGWWESVGSARRVQTRSGDAVASKNTQRLDSLVGETRRVIQPRPITPVGFLEMPDVTTPERRIVTSRQAHRGQYFIEPLNETVYLDMMLIPGGIFQMGQTDTEKAELIRLIGEDDYQTYYVRELPRHEVAVQLFFMGKYSITQAQWRAVAAYEPIGKELNSDPSEFKGDSRPVEQVNWDDATEFCQRLSAKTGRKYRLPSEAEWEYACRAGTMTPFHFGETLNDDLANYCAEDEEIDGTLYKGVYGRGILGKYRKETTEVGQFPPNQFGLYDMHGNVWEWCEDDWHSSYVGAPSDASAWVDSDRTDTYRLLRGGSWSFNPGFCRSADRYFNGRDYSNFNVGFRVCCEPPSILLST
jgi:formylglycine-generating enzyme required for sulfatase activity